jgi:hypothetical protein
MIHKGRFGETRWLFPAASADSRNDNETALVRLDRGSIVYPSTHSAGGG